MPAGRQSIPVVLVFSGLDPTGGAGIQADIEAIASMGCHAAPLVTALTAQDTRTVRRCVPVDPAILAEQARMLLQDVPVAACKIGLVASVEVAAAIHAVLGEHPLLPVVFDPVLASGAGVPLVGEAVLQAFMDLLLPVTTVLTPNSLEARRLAPQAGTLDAAAQAILDRGAEMVLVTGAHEETPKVVNTLYRGAGAVDTFEWERLPSSYHGSGCTLAAAIAGLLAQGQEPVTAIREAQEYAWESLRHGYQISRGQHIPNRLFWARGRGAG